MLKKLLKKNEANSKGFTLIEIVLVLAIAGLILVIVFLAVGGAQRSRRDAQRKSDAARVSALVTQLASNRNGTLPTVAEVNTAFNTPTAQLDPNGTPYTIVGNATPGLSAIGYVAGGACPGGTATPRGHAVYGFQETTPAVRFCANSQ